MLNEMIGGVNDMEEFCSDQELNPLPRTETVWYIPEPNYIPPPPARPSKQMSNFREMLFVILI
jgi:hypothetical protein